MFKLVAVGGKLRGQEYVMKEGENVVGRSNESDHVIGLDGISKKHMRITVNGDTAYVEDLNSANGTFINGKMIKKATVKNGDKVTLPNVILQMVYVLEKKVIIKKQVSKIDDSATPDFEVKEQAPNALHAKPIYIFKNKIMPIVHSFNEQYEWSAIVGVLLFLFIAINISLTIFPVLFESKRLLIREIALRGVQYASEVARTNSSALSRRDLDKIDTAFLENADGVESYELFDLDGRMVRPIPKLNTYINDSFSVDALKFYKSEQNLPQTFTSQRPELGQIGIARAIKAYDVRLGREEAVGIIAIRFAPQTLVVEAANNSKAYLESLATSAIVAILFFGIVYYLTIRPMEEMKFQIENVLRGKQKELESKFMFKEISSLRNTINSLLQRLRELQSTDDGGGMQDLEDEAPYIRSLYEFMHGAQGPVMILNSEKQIQHLNTEAEDLVGLRENSAQGQSLLDVARDQGFAATVIDLCDKSASNGGVNQKDAYEISGKYMNVNVCSLIGKDKFAKAFYITFVKSD